MIDRHIKDEIEDFLFTEAEVLDDRKLKTWLLMLTDDIEYVIPTRVSRDRDSDIPQFSEESYHMFDDIHSLTARVARLGTEFAWSDNPAPRTRRYVTNVRLGRAGEKVASAKSNLLLYWSIDEAQHLIAGERHDNFRRENGEWKLSRRIVLLDHVILPTPNLATFL